MAEIVGELNATYPKLVPVRHGYEAGAIIASLIREDWLYMDDISVHFSLNKHDGYMNFTERFRKNFGYDYYCDKNGAIASCPTAQTLNLKNILTMLKSKDPQLYEQQKNTLYNGTFKFLDCEPLDNQLGFVGFPRSGTSLTRRVLEQCFGIVAAANGSLHTGTATQMVGLAGQHIADNRCWVIKSHHPAAMPGVLDFYVNKTLLVVRNPLDVIVSLATFVNTMSHAAEVEFVFSEKYPQWWDWWLKMVCDKLCCYFDYLFRDCLDDKLCPLHIFRFEDLCDDTPKEIEEMMKFTLEMEELTGTNMERRIDAIREMGQKATDTYKLKEHSKNRKYNTKRFMYTDEQYNYVKEKLAKWIWFFGYAKHEGNERTGFYEYENPTNEQIESFRGFKKVNEQMLKDVCAGKFKDTKYHMNGKEMRSFELFDHKDYPNMQFPNLDYSMRKLGHKNGKQNNMFNPQN